MDESFSQCLLGVTHLIFAAQQACAQDLVVVVGGGGGGGGGGGARGFRVEVGPK